MFKPAYATWCKNCGIDWELFFTRIDGIDNRDLNYCPICGNELSSKK